MYLHAIRSFTIVCPNLDAQIRAYQLLGFSLLARAPLSHERALQLGFSTGSHPSALLAADLGGEPCLQLIELAAVGVASAWHAMRIYVVGRDSLLQGLTGAFEHLAAHPNIDGLGSSIALRGPAGETLYLCEHAAAESNPSNAPFAAIIASQAPGLSAAFYLGLGAMSKIERLPEPAASGVQLRTAHRLEFSSVIANESQNYTERQGDNAGEFNHGIYLVTLDRRGTRQQSGPARLLRGPDQELIELA